MSAFGRVVAGLAVLSELVCTFLAVWQFIRERQVLKANGVCLFIEWPRGRGPKDLTDEVRRIYHQTFLCGFEVSDRCISSQPYRAENVAACG